jgi:hypothetical protein
VKQKMESNETAKKRLQEVYGSTWEELWSSCLADSYLSGLLQLSGENVSITEAQFRAILHHLLTKEPEVKSGELFSEREDLLIHHGMSIRHCSGGKKEGISSIYTSLDPAYKYPAKGLEGKNPEEILAKQFLASVVQKALSDQFSGVNALMKELTGTGNIEQAAHQAIYPKNLIGHLIGLHHEVTFDKHTGTLYDALVAKSREEVLHAFFRYFTPQVLAQELMRGVNTNFKTNSALLSAIVDTVSDEGWDWDEEAFVPIRLNEHGALELLQATGYLSSTHHG